MPLSYKKLDLCCPNVAIRSWLHINLKFIYMCWLIEGHLIISMACWASLRTMFQWSNISILSPIIKTYRVPLKRLKRSEKKKNRKKMNIPFYFINCGELEWAWQQLKYNYHRTQLGYYCPGSCEFHSVMETTFFSKLQKIEQNLNLMYSRYIVLACYHSVL